MAANLLIKDSLGGTATVSEAGTTVVLSVAPAFGGDLTGTAVASVTVSGVQGVPVSIASLVASNVLQYNGTVWVAGAGTPPGYLYIASASGFTQTAINNAITAGYQGICVHPDVIYNAASIVLTGVNNFTFLSFTQGYLRNNAPTGYINFTTATGDCMQLINCQNIQFVGMALIGTTAAGAVLHFGGSVHASGGYNCYIRNTNGSTPASIQVAPFAWADDSQLVPGANEDNEWASTYFDGAYAAIGIGINDNSLRSNDTKMDNVRIAAGVYGVYHLNGGQWTWLNYYDRTSATYGYYVAAGGTVGNISFAGGEPWNNTSSVSVALSVNNGHVSLDNGALITVGSPGLGVQVGGSGILSFNSGRGAAASTPLVISGSGTAYFSASFDSGNFTVTGSSGTLIVQGNFDVYSNPTFSAFTGTVIDISQITAPPGLYFVHGGLTTATAPLLSTIVPAAIAAGYSGIYLDPRFIYNGSGWVMHNTNNFTVESRMQGSNGWTGAPNVSPGYIWTGTTGADGVLVYGDSGTYAEALKFTGLVFTGSNTNAVFHFAGNGRSDSFEDCYFYNQNTTAGYGFIYDTQYGANCENMYFKRVSAFGYNGFGIGINNVSGKSNDSNYTSLCTGGINIGLNYMDGGNHTITNWYDRSNATISLQAAGSCGMLTLVGGETHAAGVTMYVVNSSQANGGITIYSRQDTEGNAIIQNGNFFLMSGKGCPSTYSVTGAGAQIWIDGAYDASQPKWTGTVGTIWYATITPFGQPNFTAFTGTTIGH
jgi:hypothetical protein